MKRIRKKMTAVLLSCSLLIGGIVGRYDTTYAASVVGSYTVAQILEGIFLSFGISIFTVDMINHATNPDYWENGWVDGNAALQPTYEELEAEYNRARWEVMNGGGGDPEPSPTPGPEPTTEPDPEPEPVPGEIPTFAEWVAGVVGTGILAMSDEVWDCMGKAVSGLWDKMLGRAVVNEDIPAECLDLIAGNGYPYYSFFYGSSSSHPPNLYLFGEGSFRLPGSVDFRGYVAYIKDKYDSNFRIVSSSENSGTRSDNSTNLGFVSNLPYFSTYEEGKTWRENMSKIPNGEVIWVHPDIADTYQNKGKLEYPQQAPRPLEIPSTDALADTAKKLNPEYNPQYDPSLAPEYIKELIEQLRREQNPDPDPGTDPDPGVDPDPNPDPDPDLTPIPTPEPGDGEENDVNIPDYKTDLTKIFPFCIPFDLIHLLEVMDAPPVPPQFNFPVDIEFKNPYTGKIVFEYHNVFVVDMSVFDDVVKIVRTFEIALFLVGLMMITRSHMIKG